MKILIAGVLGGIWGSFCVNFIPDMYIAGMLALLGAIIFGMMVGILYD